MSDAVKKADRGDVESAIMDTVADLRLLNIVLNEAANSPRMDREDVMLVPMNTFWRGRARVTISLMTSAE